MTTVENQPSVRVPLKIERRGDKPVTVPEKTGMSKTQACRLAFDLVLKESELSEREIQDIWADYQYLINPRTGCPYEFIIVKLPREQNRYVRKNVEPVNLDIVKIPDTEFEFSRDRFYDSRDFQGALRAYYREMGISIALFKGQSSWTMKLFMR